jgi:GH35 family endo-1,4-beta-xylanase
MQVHFNPEERLVLEHLVDQLAETTLGRYNLELRKNLTIDVFDSDGDSFLRDNAGFFVADKHRFQQITIEPKEALKALKPSKGAWHWNFEDKAVAFAFTALAIMHLFH